MKHEWRHENDVYRAFSGEAVALHPFHDPPGLIEATRGLVVALRPDRNGMIRIRSWRVFRKLVEGYCLTNKLVLAWNRPKKGNHEFVFVSRYGGPKPEYDFIDLYALARNVCREIEKDV